MAKAQQAVQRKLNWWFLAPILAAFFLLAPMLAYPPVQDPALFLVIGRTLANGGLPYLDVLDNKPPGIYLLYSLPALGGDLLTAWYRLRVLDLLINLVSAVAIARLARSILGKDAALPAAVWFVALTNMNGHWVTAQTEVWANAPILITLSLLMEPPKSISRYRLGFIIGLLTGCIALLKPTCIFPLVAGLLAYPWLRPGTNRGSSPIRWPKALGFGAWWLAGICAVVLPVAFWLWRGGAIPAFLDLYTGFIKPYLNDGKAPFGLKAVFYLRAFASHLIAFAPLLTCVLLGMITRHVWSMRTYAWVWVLGLAAFYSMWSQGRAINYYFQVLTVPAALFGTAGLLALARAATQKQVGWKSGFIATVPVMGLSLWNSGSRDLAALQFVAGTRSTVSYIQAFNTSAETNGVEPLLQVTSYIRQHSRPEDRILSWVHEGNLYVWSNRMPANRFFHALGLVRSDAPAHWRREYVESMRTNPPKFFVVVKGQDYSWLNSPQADSYDLFTHWRELKSVIDHQFYPARPFGDFLLFERKTGSGPATQQPR